MLNFWQLAKKPKDFGPKLELLSKYLTNKLLQNTVTVLDAV